MTLKRIEIFTPWVRDQLVAKHGWQWKATISGNDGHETYVLERATTKGNN